MRGCLRLVTRSLQLVLTKGSRGSPKLPPADSCRLQETRKEYSNIQVSSASLKAVMSKKVQTHRPHHLEPSIPTSSISLDDWVPNVSDEDIKITYLILKGTDGRRPAEEA